MIKYDGSPILLDDSVENDVKVRTVLDRKRVLIDDLENQVIGRTKVILNGNRVKCCHFECNSGNLISDALVYGRVIEDYGGMYWTDAAIGVMNGGGM